MSLKLTSTCKTKHDCGCYTHTANRKFDSIIVDYQLFARNLNTLGKIHQYIAHFLRIRTEIHFIELPQTSGSRSHLGFTLKIRKYAKCSGLTTNGKKHYHMVLTFKLSFLS